MLTFLDLMASIGSVASELSRLLGVQFVPGQPSLDTPVGRSQERVLDLWNAGRHDEVEWELMRLSLLAKSLRTIEEGDPVILRNLARRLLNSELASHFGASHEVAIAASLLARNVSLRHEPPGGPDFEIQTSSGRVGIECTSVHIAGSVETADLYVVEPTEPGPKDLSYKLASKVREKGSKPYAAPNVLLTIDATNISALSGSDQLSFDAATAALAKTPYGGMLIWQTLINLDVEPSMIEAGYVRRDASTTIAPALRRFVDEYWPTGGVLVERHVMPLVGF